MEHLQSEEPFSSDPYFSAQNLRLINNNFTNISSQYGHRNMGALRYKIQNNLDLDLLNLKMTV